MFIDDSKSRCVLNCLKRTVKTWMGFGGRSLRLDLSIKLGIGGNAYIFHPFSKCSFKRFLFCDIFLQDEYSRVLSEVKSELTLGNLRVGHTDGIGVTAETQEGSCN